jgi:hypothetical protein
VLQRHVRLHLLPQDQQVPGNRGAPAMPTAAVVVAFLAQVALVQCWLGEYDIEKIYIIKIHYLMIFEALGLPHSWYATPSAQKTVGHSDPL